MTNSCFPLWLTILTVISWVVQGACARGTEMRIAHLFGCVVVNPCFLIPKAQKDAMRQFETAYKDEDTER